MKIKHALTLSFTPAQSLPMKAWGMQLRLDYESLLTSPTHQLTLNEAKDNARTHTLTHEYRHTEWTQRFKLVPPKNIFINLGLSEIQNATLGLHIQGERTQMYTHSIWNKTCACVESLSVSDTHEMHVWVNSWGDVASGAFHILLISSSAEEWHSLTWPLALR